MVRSRPVERLVATPAQRGARGQVFRDEGLSGLDGVDVLGRRVHLGQAGILSPVSLLLVEHGELAQGAVALGFRIPVLIGDRVASVVLDPEGTSDGAVDGDAFLAHADLAPTLLDLAVGAPVLGGVALAQGREPQHQDVGAAVLLERGQRGGHVATIWVVDPVLVPGNDASLQGGDDLVDGLLASVASRLVGDPALVDRLAGFGGSGHVDQYTGVSSCMWVIWGYFCGDP